MEIKLQNVMAVYSLQYGSETWLLNQKDYSSLTAAQMVYERLYETGMLSY